MLAGEQARSVQWEPPQPKRSSRTFANWLQRKWISVLEGSGRSKSKREVNFIPPIQVDHARRESVATFQSVKEKKPVDEDLSSTTDTMTAEEFAKAVGMQILVTSDSEEDNESTMLSTTSTFGPQAVVPESCSTVHGCVEAPSLIRRTSVNSSGSVRYPSIRRNYTPLDMTLFEAPIVQAPAPNNATGTLPPTPSSTLSSPLSPTSSTESQSHITSPLSLSCSLPTRSPTFPPTNNLSQRGNRQARLADRRVSVCIPIALRADQGSPRQPVEVTNKGRFTLTRERSDHFTARRPTHARTISCSSRFQVVREEPVSPLDVADAVGSSDDSAAELPSRRLHAVPQHGKHASISGSLTSTDSAVAL
ncbi:hypothetical protein BC832DRAFT_592869 [Gaertneriomyces semiglobifer]|nr:hypothetical protein BC832DRAFT_592869 [Gaertneriomyces semiglobifer]